MSERTVAGPRPVRAGFILALVLGALAAGCKHDVLGNAACENDRFDLYRPTQGKMLAFVLQQPTIRYHYREIQPTDTTLLTWDSSAAYYGGACLRFQTTDSVQIASSGAFQFLMSGSNAGTVWRTYKGVTDSVSAYLFFGCEGDGGTYSVSADHTIQYQWSNGQQYRLFGPVAVHTLVGDTIWVTSEESYRADSTHASWRAAWVRGYCGE